MKAYEVRIFGRVQRVGYRRYILDLAQEMKLNGYVENLKDGSVYVFIQGEEDILNKFLERIKEPPEPAKVDDIKVSEVGIKPELKYFTLKPGELYEELNEGLGAMQNIFMQYWREFKDFRREFNEFKSEFQNLRSGFSEFKESTNQNFKTLMERYGDISSKLTTILETLQRESEESRKYLIKLYE